MPKCSEAGAGCAKIPFVIQRDATWVMLFSDTGTPGKLFLKQILKILIRVL